MSDAPNWIVALQKSRADETAVETPNGKLRVYRDANREWRWQALTPNGKIVADSGESKARYRHYAERTNFINRTINLLPWDILSVIGVEALHDMKRGKQKRRGKAFRKAIAPWVYRRVLDRISHKATENRVRLIAVEPAYTSQTCPTCHTVSRENRRGEKFHCVACNRSGDADHIGAINILARTHETLRSVESLGPIKAV